MDEAQLDREHDQVLSLVRQHQFDDALELCRRNIEAWEPPYRHEALHNLGYVLWSAGRRDEAIDAMSRAIELSPDDRRHRLSRARWALDAGKLETAEGDWTELIRLEEAMDSVAFLGMALLGRACTYAELTRYEAAIADIERVDDSEVIVFRNRLMTASDLRAQLSAR